jgi:hypothetical protein
LPKPTGVEQGHSEALVDPRDRRIFYVGKGKGHRVYQHARNVWNDVSDRLPRGSQNPIRYVGC